MNKGTGRKSHRHTSSVLWSSPPGFAPRLRYYVLANKSMWKKGFFFPLYSTLNQRTVGALKLSKPLQILIRNSPPSATIGFKGECTFASSYRWTVFNSDFIEVQVIKSILTENRALPWPPTNPPDHS